MNNGDRLLTSEEFLSMAERGELVIVGDIHRAEGGYMVTSSASNGDIYRAGITQEDTLRLQRILNIQTQLNVQEENK